jgi:hypothetical protein
VILFIVPGGEHTLTKTVVTSKIGGLAAFTKKRETCIGCKTPLDKAGLSIIDIAESCEQIPTFRYRCVQALRSK